MKSLISYILLLLLLISSFGCKPNEVDIYAKQLNLPDEDREIVKQLGYDGMDASEKAVIDEYNLLLQSKQLTEQSLSYFRALLKSIAEDGKVSNDELNNFKDPDKDGFSNSEELKYKTETTKPNPNVKYAIDKGLSAFVDEIKIMDEDGKQDKNERLFIDGLLAPENLYLITIPAYGKKLIIDVAKNGVSNEKITAFNYLSKQSLDTKKQLIDFGLDGDVPTWLVLNSTLPKDFADYVIKNKLCIQDKKLTELEKKFLKEPDKYIKQLFDFNISEIAKIDPGLATQLKKLPYFKEIDLEDVEVLEDVYYLASNPKYKATLEKLYGKGIERKMRPVALEAMVWRGIKNEFDIKNPLEGADLTTLTRLADFQAKYNKEMDMEGVTGPKPKIRGMNILGEPRGYTVKSEDDYIFDYALMRWVLRANTVRLWGQDSNAFYHVRLAHNEGLEVYLQFEPIWKNPDMDLVDYKKQLADFAKKAQEHNIKILSVGNEVELWSRKFGGGPWSWGPQSFKSRQNSDVVKFINDLIQNTRQVYSGLLTYSDYWAWGLKKVDWKPMDIVSLNIYKGKAKDEDFLGYILHMKNNYSKPFNKPLYITEVGSLTVTEAEEAGGDDSYLWRFPVRHNPEKQAQVIDRQLKLIYQAKVDGVFVFCWTRPADFPKCDMNKYGFGIWDYVKKEPKPRFFCSL